jgi:hypothetical protein
MGEERRAQVLGLGCSNSVGVSSYGTRATGGNILLTFGGGDGRGCLATAAQWRQNSASVSGFSDGSPSKVRVGLAPEWLGDASRPDSGAQNGLGVAADRGEDLRSRLGLVDQFAREELLFIGGNPSTCSGRGDDLDSISNLKQTWRIAIDFGKGINSVWKTLCGYERCRVQLRLLAGWTGSVKEGIEWAVLGCAALRANGRPTLTGPRWATPEWGGGGKGNGCWVGLGLRPGFGPQSV